MTRQGTAVLSITLLLISAPPHRARAQEIDTLVLDPVPLITLGSSDADPLYRVVGAGMVDGMVVVADGGSLTLRYYSMDGELVRTVGREGDGPGEFQRIDWLQQVGDQVYVFDHDLNRLSEFDAHGDFVRSVTIRPMPGYTFPLAAGVFPDRSVLVQAFGGADSRIMQPESEIYRTRFTLLRYDSAGREVDSLGASLWSEMYARANPGGGGFVTAVAAGRHTRLLVQGWHYLEMLNNEPVISAYDTSGVRVLAFREDRPNRSRRFTDRDMERIREQFSAQWKPPADMPAKMRRDVQDAFAEMPIAPEAPPFGWAGTRPLSVLRAGQDGSVWALEFGGVQQMRPVWVVFRPDGTPRAHVIAEQELDLLYVDEDVLIVHRWDDLDVETVEVRRVP